jgi:F-type H+-transporting ATPase subunit a
MEHSIAAGVLFDIGGMNFTNTMLASLITTFVMIVLALVVRAKLSQKPGKIQILAELIVDYIYGLCVSIADEKRAKAFFPWIVTFFTFILFSNIIGLFPGRVYFVFSPALFFCV